MSSTALEKKPRLTTSAMIASIASEGQRVHAAPFGKALVEYAASHAEVVGLTADLAKYTDLHLFAKAYPVRVNARHKGAQHVHQPGGQGVRQRRKHARRQPRYLPGSAAEEGLHDGGDGRLQQPSAAGVRGHRPDPRSH